MASTASPASSSSRPPRPAFHLSLPLSTLRPSYSAEDVPLNLGVDEDESPSPLLTRSNTPASVSAGLSALEGRDAFARFSLGWEEEDGADTTSATGLGEGDFDCHICLRTATNPCVTRCGHLFCYDDLEQWLRIHPRCPVCSAFISLSHDVVKIFGRGRDARHRRRSSASSSAATESALPEGRKPPPPPGSSVPSLPSPPATPSPPRPPVPLPDASIDAPSSTTVASPATMQTGMGSKETPPIVQPPHPLLVEQLLRHQFARILSLVALVFFLLLIGWQRG